MLYSSRFLREVELFIEDYKLEYFNFFHYVYEQLKNAPEKVKAVIQSLENDSIVECKDSYEKLIEYYSEKNNFKNICDGIEGMNVKYKHKGLMLSNYNIDAWLEFVFSCLKQFLTLNNIEIGKDYDDIKLFTVSKFNGILDPEKTHLSIINSFNYDVISWTNQQDRTKTLKTYNSKEYRIKFFFNKNQITQRVNLFKKFKNYTSYDLANIVEIIYPPHNIHRKYQIDN